MKASKQKNTFTVLFLVGVALYMTACGSSSANNSEYDFSSRAPITSDPSAETPTTSANISVATCNYRTNSDIGAKLKMFVDRDTNTYRMDMVQVRLTTIPADFENNTTYFGMWKWLGLTGATTQTLGGEALRFAVYDSYTGKYLTDFKTTLMWKDVSAVAKSLGVPSASIFFSRVTIIVNLAAPSDTYSINEYDALKVVSYTTATQKVATTLDVLLPPYAANPTDYAKETTGAVRAPVLQNLHPLASLKGGNYTSTQFLEMTKNYCF